MSKRGRGGALLSHAGVERGEGVVNKRRYVIGDALGNFVTMIDVIAVRRRVRY